MKVFVYNYRDFDEAAFFTTYSKEYKIDLGHTNASPTLANADLAKGYDCISIITTKIDADLVTRFHELGIKLISTRTIGYDHICLSKARELGIKVSNASYDPSGVADYAVMLMLMGIRNMKRIMERAYLNDFSLPGLMGTQLSDYTVGVLGTGKIGKTVINNLSGFGCKIYAYDQYPDSSVEKYATYTDLDTLLHTCNLLTLHMPLNDQNQHIINEAAINKMPAGTIIVNTARGGLIDTPALINGIESGKLGAVCLDVIEQENGLYYYDLKSQVMNKHDLSILKDYPNVIVTPHMAFYTQTAIKEMVLHSLQSCCHCMNGTDDPYRIL